jgi:DNA polymerase III subunit delta'
MSFCKYMEKLEFPWHATAWREFEAALAADRLGHAYLIEGPQGLGKLHLAFRMAARVLGAPWPAADPPGPLLHPDLNWVTLAIDDEGKQKKQIGIQQIREACANLAMTSYSGGWKVAVVWPAEQLNPHSANALLKTLEEPAPRTLLLLVRSRLDTLPATIASRCQRVRIPPPPPAEAIAWLEARAGAGEWQRLLSLAGDAPLMALLLAEEGFRELDKKFAADLLGILGQRREPLEVAAEWAKQPLPMTLRWLDVWTTELVRWKAAAATPSLEAAPQRALQTALERIPLHRLFRYKDEVRSAMTRNDGVFNTQMVLEGLLVPWADRLEAVVGDAAQGMLSDR